MPHIFVIAVMDSQINDHMRYVRPEGEYWDALGDNTNESYVGALKTTSTLHPILPVLDVDSLTPLGDRTTRGTPLYGMNHIARPHDSFGGGWCPMKGGDYGRYPEAPAGGGFQNQYEEISPLCDAIVLDIKLWTNLDVPTWSDPKFQLNNAGVKENPMVYLGEGAVLWGFG
jgi:hypothetical protein